MPDPCIYNHCTSLFPAPTPIQTCRAHGVLHPPGLCLSSFPHFQLSAHLSQMLPLPLLIPLGYHYCCILSITTARYPPRFPWELHPAPPVSIMAYSSKPPLVTPPPCVYLKDMSQHHPLGYRPLPMTNLCFQQPHNRCPQAIQYYQVFVLIIVIQLSKFHINDIMLLI